MPEAECKCVWLVGYSYFLFPLIRLSESRLDFVVFTEVPEGGGELFV